MTVKTKLSKMYAVVIPGGQTHTLSTSVFISFFCTLLGREEEICAGFGFRFFQFYLKLKQTDQLYQEKMPGHYEQSVRMNYCHMWFSIWVSNK